MADDDDEDEDDDDDEEEEEEEEEEASKTSKGPCSAMARHCLDCSRTDPSGHCRNRTGDVGGVEEGEEGGDEDGEGEEG